MMDMKESRKGSKPIGAGAHGKIYPYHLNKEDPNDEENKKWVIKEVNVEENRQLLNSLNEIVLGFSLKHSSLVPVTSYKILELEVGGFQINLVLPRMKESLKAAMESRFKEFREKAQFEETEIVEYLYSLVCGIEYLHENKIIHRDIKPANILLDDFGNAKLSDIGLAVLSASGRDHSVAGFAGSPFYMAPEIFEKKSMIKSELFPSDLWSLGVVGLELCDLTLWKKRRNMEKEKRLDQEDIKKCLTEIRAKKPYCKELTDLIGSMLDRLPEKRISAMEARIKIEELRQIIDQKKNNHLSKNEYLAHRLKRNQMTLLDVTIENETFTLKIKKGASSYFDNNSMKRLVSDIQDQCKKKPLSGISTAKIELQDCSLLSSEGFSSLKELLNWSLEGIEDLRLDLEGCEKMNDLDLSGFLIDLKELAFLDLKLKKCKNITSKGFERLMKSLRNLEKLQSLTLDLSGCIGLRAAEVNSIIEQNFVRDLRLKKLQCLYLDFSDCGFTESESNKLAYTLSRDRVNLQAFELILRSASFLEVPSNELKSGKIGNSFGNSISFTNLTSSQII